MYFPFSWSFRMARIEVAGRREIRSRREVGIQPGHAAISIYRRNDRLRCSPKQMNARNRTDC